MKYFGFSHPGVALLSKRYTLVLAGVVALLSVGILSFGVNSKGSEANPDSGPPAADTASENAHSHDDAALEFRSDEAVGFVTTARDFDKDMSEAPFDPMIPEFIPEGLALERYNVMAFGRDATIDIVYTIPADASAAWQPAVHVWQTNRPYQIPAAPAQGSDEDGTFVVDGQSWTYWLLSYPQPGGEVLELYDAEINMPDGTSLAIDIRVGLDPTPAEREEALNDLQQVIASLVPFSA